MFLTLYTGTGKDASGDDRMSRDTKIKDLGMVLKTRERGTFVVQG